MPLLDESATAFDNFLEKFIKFQLKNPAGFDGFIGCEPGEESQRPRETPPVAADPSEASKLVLLTNKSRLVSKKCNCGCCPTCSKSQKWKLRQVLLNEKYQLFPHALMITLSSGQESPYFTNAAEAYQYVTDGGFVSRAMQEVGIKKYIWAIEFHAGRPDNNFAHRGYVHWHIIAQRENGQAFLPKDSIAKMRHLWRDVWKIGNQVNVTAAKKSGKYAINYITKYISKNAGSVPGWFMKLSKARLFQASKAVGALVFRYKSADADPLREKRIRAGARPFLARVVGCGSKSIIQEEVVDKRTGVVWWRYVRTVDIKYDQLKRCIRAGFVDWIKIVLVPKTMCAGFFDVLCFGAVQSDWDSLVELVDSSGACWDLLEVA